MPYRDDAEDPEALLLAARKAGAPLVYLANPDNPMGSWHAGARIAEMIARLPGGAVLCLDEAYADFAPAGAIPPIDPDEPRVIRMRTFSKAHGMAGARIGYAIGHPDLIAAFDRVRNHFGVNRIARPARWPSLADRTGSRGHRRGRRARARDRRHRRGSGLPALPSATNFVTIDCGRDGAFARRVLTGSSPAACSSACRPSRRWTAASASPSAARRPRRLRRRPARGAGRRAMKGRAAAEVAVLCH